MKCENNCNKIIHILLNLKAYKLGSLKIKWWGGLPCIELDYNFSRQLPSIFLLIGGHHFSHSPVIGSLLPDSFQISLTHDERSKRIIKKRINLIFLSTIKIHYWEIQSKWILKCYSLFIHTQTINTTIVNDWIFVKSWTNLLQNHFTICVRNSVSNYKISVVEVG